MKSLVRNIVVPFLLLFFSASSFAQKPAATLPLFTFFQMNGKPFTKASVTASKNSVFIFFDVSCEHCQKLVTEINTKFGLFKKAEFYFISMYQPVDIQKFMVQYGKTINGKANVVLLQDKNQEFIPKFLPEKYPAVYVYSPKGNLIRYFSGDKNVNDAIVAANSSVK